jgi:hypothetical protein
MCRKFDDYIHNDNSEPEEQLGGKFKKPKRIYPFNRVPKSFKE